MIKIKILPVSTEFIEINYGDFAANFGKSNHIFNKFSVDILLSVDKQTLTVTWTGSFIIVTITTIGYIDTLSTTVEEFYNELKTFL